MQIYYLFNSGFAVVIDKRLLVFDYARTVTVGNKNLTGGVVTSADIEGFDDVLVFVSHHHTDHFTPATFAWQHFKPDIRFVLSTDLRDNLSRPLAFPQNTYFMGAGDRLAVGDVCVQAFGSTDEGNSFYVECGGYSLFHAGDLNLWHWQDHSTPSEVEFSEREFAAELDTLAAAIQHIDVAFFPVDPRMGTDFARGAVQFIERMKPKLFVPMHFGADVKRIDEFFQMAEQRKYNVASISRRGELITYP